MKSSKQNLRLAAAAALVVAGVAGLIGTASADKRPVVASRGTTDVSLVKLPASTGSVGVGLVKLAPKK